MFLNQPERKPQLDDFYDIGGAEKRDDAIDVKKLHEMLGKMIADGRGDQEVYPLIAGIGGEPLGGGTLVGVGYDEDKVLIMVFPGPIEAWRNRSWDGI